MELIWQDPPSRPVSQLEEVRRQLKERPGKWALIDRQTGLSILPWWGPINMDKNFEMKFEWLDKSVIFGPRDIYARYIGGNNGQ